MAEPKYFRMTCQDAQAKVTLVTSGTPAAVTLSYRLNGGAWSGFDNEAGVDLNPGDYVEFKGDNVRIGEATNKYRTFTITGDGKIKLSGDITTLLDPAGSVTELAANQSNCFIYLFKEQKNIIDAGDMVIPIEKCVSGCFQYMFTGSGITRAPYMKITTSARNAIAYMFNGCRNLSYVKFGGPSNNMFGSTISLAWLASVAADGIFEVEDPDFDMDITRGTASVPVGWTLRRAGSGLELYFNGKKVQDLTINGKIVMTLFINGKQL